MDAVSHEVSLVRHENSLDLVDNKVVEDFGMEKQASIILLWYCEFVNLDGRLRLDCRGVHEREWILCEEDKQLQLLGRLKKQKRLIRIITYEYINKELFAGEK